MTSAQTHTFSSFREFWPHYVGEHRRPLNRAIHYLGALLVLSLVVLAIWQAAPMYLAFAPIAGYGLAWFGHVLIERNRPATWSYIAWSFLGEWKMFFLAVTGRMRDEVERLYPSDSVSGSARDSRLRR